MNQERFFCEGRVCLWSIHTVEAEETVKFVVIKLAGIGKKRGKSDCVGRHPNCRHPINRGRPLLAPSHVCLRVFAAAVRWCTQTALTTKPSAHIYVQPSE